VWGEQGKGHFYWKFVIRGKCPEMLDVLEKCKFKRIEEVSGLSETWNIMEMWQITGLFQTLRYSPELCKNWKIVLTRLSKSGTHTKNSRKTINIYNWQITLKQFAYCPICYDSSKIPIDNFKGNTEIHLYWICIKALVYIAHRSLT